MATHSSIFTWKIPWTEEPGRPQSMGVQKLGHDQAQAHIQTYIPMTVLLNPMEQKSQFSSSIRCEHRGK